MKTMQPVLQVGPFDWAASPLTLDAAQARLNDVKSFLRQRGWAGLLAFGDRSEYGTVGYLTNYAPRLSGAIVLVAAEGEPRILSFEGGRMIDAGKETTWVGDVRPIGNLAATIGEWVDAIGAHGRIATSDLGIMSDKVYRDLSALPAITGAPDATQDILSLRRRKSDHEVSLLRDAARALGAAEQAVRKCFAAGDNATACLLAGEAAAMHAGAQDVRILFSVDGGRTLLPADADAPSVTDSLTVYYAIRQWGYWVDGFITATATLSTTQKAVRAALDAALKIARAGVTSAELIDAAYGGGGKPDRHSLLGDGCGHGVGTSLTEWPCLDRPQTTLDVADVISLKVSLPTPDGGFAFGSALAHIGETGTDILWREQD